MGLPTDLQLLQEIYTRNLKAFSEYSEDDKDKTRSTKIWVPIGIEGLAKRFRCDPDLIFGRLYYHLNGKYSQPDPAGEKTLNFFQMRVGRDMHCVNFPFLASVLADLKEERRRFVLATGIAALSLVISAISIFIALNA